MKQWKRSLSLIGLIVSLTMFTGCQKEEKTPPAPTPTTTPEVTVTTAPTEAPTATVEPTATVVPTATVAPTATSKPTATVAPTATPKPTATTAPTATPKPTATVAPTATPKPTATTAPTATPKPTATTAPTATPVTTKAPEAPETKNTLTGLTAFEITSQMIVGWNLGNTLDSVGSNIEFDTAPAKSATAWGNIEPSKELFEAVQAAGFNTVRIPTTWYQHVKYDNTQKKYVINEAWLNYVKQTVDYAYELDMFIILNVHHEDWVNVSQFTDAAYNKTSAMLADIWGQVAETFAEYDQHLIFEGMNEPRQTGLGGDVEWGGGDTGSWSYINKLNQVFVSAVRGQGSKANAERLLVIPGYAASSNIATIKAIEVPANGGNIALSVHAYFPYFFAMDSGSYANHSFPGKSGYGEDYETSITNLFRDLKKIIADKNVPIIIGEFGASDFNNDDDRARWATHFLTCAKDAKIPCVFWDNGATYNGTGEAYGLIYRKTRTWFDSAVPMLNAVMKVYGQESNLPAYEEYVQPAFNWDLVGVTSDWKQIYRDNAGTKIDTWGNIWLEGWKPYLNENYDIVLIFDSEAEPYMVLQPVWHKVYAGQVSSNPYMIRFTYADLQKTLNTENVKLENVTGYFTSASSKPMTVYGVFAVPVK